MDSQNRKLLRALPESRKRIDLEENSGEPNRIRTCDPLIKSQLLYQLSYGPNTGRFSTGAEKEGQGQIVRHLAES